MDDQFVYLSAQQIVDNPRYPFTMGQLRHFLLKRHKNGLEKSVRRIGKRLYFRQDRFKAEYPRQRKSGRGVHHIFSTPFSRDLWFNHAGRRPRFSAHY